MGKKVCCMWVDDHGVEHRGLFDEDDLKVVTPEATKRDLVRSVIDELKAQKQRQPIRY